MKKLLLLGLCVLLPSLLYGAFEDVEMGARATAVGGAFVAQDDDVTSIFYNPAGLAGIKRYELSASYENLYYGLTDGSSIGRNVIAFGMPVTYKRKYWGNAGFGWNRLSLSGLYDEGTISFSYAYPFGEKLWAGVNINRLSVSYGSDEYTALNPVFDAGSQKSAMGIDLGLQRRIDNVTLGLAIQNANEPDLGLKYENKVDRKISAGFTLHQEASAWSGVVMLVNKDIRFKTGTEIALLKKLLKDRVVGRAGFSIGSRDYRNAALGFGYRESAYRIDYAFVYPLSGISETWGSHRLTMSFGWGAPLDALNVPALTDMSLKELLNMRVSSIEGEGTFKGSLQMEQTAPREITPEEKKRANDLIANAKVLVSSGAYGDALGMVQEADGIFKTYVACLSIDQMMMPESDDVLAMHQEAKALIGQLSPVVAVSTAVVAADRQGTLLRRSVDRYLGKDAEAVNFITFAYQQWPDDKVVQGLRDVITRFFPEESSKLKFLSGITIVDQQLQEALDLIRSSRFIQAVNVLEKTLDMDPDNITALKRMGSAYWAMGKKDMARTYWRRVLQLDPNDRDVKVFLRGN